MCLEQKNSAKIFFFSKKNQKKIVNFRYPEKMLLLSSLFFQKNKIFDFHLIKRKLTSWIMISRLLIQALCSIAYAQSAWNNYQSNNRTNVLIIGEYRGGANFVGEFFNNNEKVTYIGSVWEIFFGFFC